MFHFLILPFDSATLDPQNGGHWVYSAEAKLAFCPESTDSLVYVLFEKEEIGDHILILKRFFLVVGSGCTKKRQIYQVVYPSNFKRAVHIQPFQKKSQGVHLILPHKLHTPLGDNRDLNLINTK